MKNTKTHFNEAEIYKQNDDIILKILGSAKRQAQLRYYNRSPEYFKVGNKIFYVGSALNDFISQQMEVCNAK